MAGADIGDEGSGIIGGDDDGAGSGGDHHKITELGAVKIGGAIVVVVLDAFGKIKPYIAE